MAGRILVGCLGFLAIAALALGCGGSGKGGVKLEARCEQLAKTCGDGAKSEKQTAALIEECKVAAATQIKRGCTAKALAAYDCFEKKVCGQGEPVWALDDFRVLTKRHGACIVERDALDACVGK